MNEEKYQNFSEHGLIICDVTISATIKNNALNLINTFGSISGDKILCAVSRQFGEDSF